jgi:hypothetical protein
MSRGGIGLVLVPALVTFALLAAGGGAAAPAQELPPAKPTVLVGPLSPLTVRGVRFKPHERVTVTLDGGTRGTARVTASRTGGFRAEFRITLRPCRTVTIRATGSRGSKAVRQLPRPNCREP